MVSPVIFAVGMSVLVYLVVSGVWAVYRQEGNNG